MKYREIVKVMDTATNVITVFLHTVEEIMDNGGPELSDYDYLLEASTLLMDQNISLSDSNKLFEIIQPILTKDCVVGFSYLKPHGYTGDFEIIDRMYQKWKSPNSDKYHKWDAFFHSLHSVRAVRNRKQYLVNQLKELSARVEKPKVLDLASGPCTDLYEFFIQNPNTEAHIDCLDMDEKAIEYGLGVCDNYIDSISFINRNAFRYRPDKQYDLIWSAGLFDYFSDKLFIRLLSNMYRLLGENGKLIIGNFSDYNPSRGAMELFGQWYLHYRGESELIDLAVKGGVPRSKINVYSEEIGVNLFLHLDK